MLARQKWQINTINVLDRVFEERCRQVATYGTNYDIEDGTGPGTRWLLPYTSQSAAEIEVGLRRDYEDHEAETGNPTWVHLIREEVAEAFKEDDPETLTRELIQVAALCTSWVEKIEARSAF